MKEKESKTIKAFLNNPEGAMKLTIKGKNATDQGIKIIQTFDDICKEIRKKEDDNKK